MSISPLQRCSSTNRFDEPCQAKPITKDEDGRPLCSMHSGLSDPKAMGRAGGLRKPETELRKAVKQDDEIREQAREVIKRAMTGDESITKPMLDAARSLFAFRASQPPSEHEPREVGIDHAGGFGLADLVALALFGDGGGGRILTGPGDGDPLRNDPEWRALGARIAARLESIRAENGNHPEAA